MQARIGRRSFIGAAIFDPGWRARLGRDYNDIAWAETGERLTEESFLRYREQEPNGRIVAHVMDEENVVHALVHPDEWEKALSPGGALDAAVEAREQGLARFIGITA